MPTDRDVQEIIAHCVSCMVIFQHSRMIDANGRYRAVMATEVRETARTVAAWGLDGQTADRILRPVERELVDRYGSATGMVRFQELSTAFRPR